MIQNKITLIPLNSILISRETRQRSSLPRILDLALEIAASQWINPILIDESTNQLIAGERRYSAVRLLHQARTFTLPQSFLDSTPKEQINQLTTAKCKVDSLEHWTKIPAQLGKNITPIDLMLFEFRENVSREDLSWQDKTKAIYQIHSLNLQQQEEWTLAHTARQLNLSISLISDSIAAWRAAISGDEKLGRIVQESSGLESAMQALRRTADRREGPLTLAPKPKPAEAAAEPSYKTTETSAETKHPTPKPSLAEQSILRADFTKFAPSYTGEPFNFLHLDFPYGINFAKGGDNQSSSIDAKLLGEYDDSPEIFWTLLQTLATNQKKLIAESAHLLLWYSQNYDREVMDFLDSSFPAKRWTHRLIWHCSNMSGILPDSQRSGRRTYETAFILAFGDRKIAKPTSLSCSFPRTNKIHRSEKPLDVLSFFFPMFVDETSSVFDPTCGSGSSLIAAHKLGARRVLGLEIDPETHQRAVEYFNQEVK
jgi:ParB-like chromosome segregation protein Spo0J/DNA modification methylase